MESITWRHREFQKVFSEANCSFMPTKLEFCAEKTPVFSYINCSLFGRNFHENRQQECSSSSRFKKQILTLKKEGGMIFFPLGRKIIALSVQL